jgi:hypothetical protein
VAEPTGDERRHQGDPHRVVGSGLTLQQGAATTGDLASSEHAEDGDTSLATAAHTRKMAGAGSPNRSLAPVGEDGHQQDGADDADRQAEREDVVPPEVPEGR